MGIISSELNKRYRNQLNTVIRSAKKTYYHNAFLNNKSDIKKTWLLIKKLLSKNTNARNIISIITNNETVTDSAAIAECFNDYFSSIAQSLDSNILQTDTSAFNYVTQNIQSTFFFTPVTAQDIVPIISKLKNTSSNVSNIPPRILKHVKEIIAGPIAEIVNRSMEQGVFPGSLKTANIVPIYKAGDAQFVSNYRPIAILPTMSKIFEKCIANKLINFFSKFNIISPYQYGFLKGKSTTNAFQLLIEYIYNCLNKKQQ